MIEINHIPESIRHSEEVDVAWRPRSDPQSSLVRCPMDEVLYGGAAGGGKTDGCIGDFLIHAGKYGKNAKGIFFRHTTKQLEQVVDRGRVVYGRVGARFVGGSKSLFKFPNGATLKIRHLRTMSDAENYQGHQYTRMYFEEMTNWPTKGPIMKVMARLRSPAGVPCRAIATANPGGKGHNWVKSRYKIGSYPGGYRVIQDPVTELFRTYIPARLEDNEILQKNDPNYEKRLRQAGPREIVEAWRWGNWDIVAGGYFDDVWDERFHIIEPFSIPRSWTLRRSFDWGSASPSSLGIWAISNGQQPKGYSGPHIPKGSAVRVDELYTVATDQNGEIIPDEGLRQNNDTLGRMIAEISRKHGNEGRFHGCVADPSIFSEEGGPSIYKQMQKGARQVGQVFQFRRADNNRIPGWLNMRSMMENAIHKEGERAERPSIYVFRDCEHFIRTVPVLQRDEKNQDDIDTDSEDHIGDESRYLVQSLGYKSFRKAKVTGY